VLVHDLPCESLVVALGDTQAIGELLLRRPVATPAPEVHEPRPILARQYVRKTDPAVANLARRVRADHLSTGDHAPAKRIRRIALRGNDDVPPFEPGRASVGHPAVHSQAPVF